MTDWYQFINHVPPGFNSIYANMLKLPFDLEIFKTSDITFLEMTVKACSRPHSETCGDRRSLLLVLIHLVHISEGLQTKHWSTVRTHRGRVANSSNKISKTQGIRLRWENGRTWGEIKGYREILLWSADCDWKPGLCLSWGWKHKWHVGKFERISHPAPCEMGSIPPNLLLSFVHEWKPQRSSEFGFCFQLDQTPSLLACVSTTLSTGMNADVSLKLLLLTMWVWMLRPSV